jgi:hypothetical protein
MFKTILAASFLTVTLASGASAATMKPMMKKMDHSMSMKKMDDKMMKKPIKKKSMMKKMMKK